ncbi:MAG: hypothetical protein BMS9Abin28_1673 [Anaerolineae bacterium]|nr:MAG: hypothetical protein BMS9Abin28_1673 [Anaerolineae bacterium]
MTSESKYRIIEVDLADAARLVDWKQAGVVGAGFGLKGFDYPWIATSRDWKPDEAVLDVGAGYSPLPAHLASEYGCEMWAVDDFGITSDEPFWRRGQDPEEFIRTNPNVNYVLERLGDPSASTLKSGYFDCIYSASTLEHVPYDLIRPVWRHMDRLLKPGGELLHAIDIKLPTHRGLLSLSKALMLDVFGPLIPAGYRNANAYYTPKSYLRRLSSEIHLDSSASPSSIGVINMVLSPRIVLEPLDWVFNRIVKDGFEEVPFIRVTSLLIHLRKLE